MNPSQFEMTPKVDVNLRVAMCNLGLFNLQDINISQSENDDTTEFALGQNFIRTYNMTMKFVERQSSDDISLSVFIGSTTHKESFLSQLWYMLATGMALLAYVGCLSVTKFRRVKQEKVEFELIKNVVKELPTGEAKQMFAAQQVEDDFIKGRDGGQPLNLQLAKLN